MSQVGLDLSALTTGVTTYISSFGDHVPGANFEEEFPSEHIKREDISTECKPVGSSNPCAQQSRQRFSQGWLILLVLWASLHCFLDRCENSKADPNDAMQELSDEYQQPLAGKSGMVTDEYQQPPASESGMVTSISASANASNWSSLPDMSVACTDQVLEPILESPNSESVVESSHSHQIAGSLHGKGIPSTCAGGAPNKVFSVALERQQQPAHKAGERNAYFGTLSVGSPPQPFKAVLDTGSGHLILPSMYCHSDACKAHNRYKRSASSTARDIDWNGTLVQPGQPRDQLTVSFGTGEVTGVFVEDIMCLDRVDEASRIEASEGALASSQLPEGCMRMRFIAATAMSEAPFKDFEFDGILGLGLDALSQTQEFNFLHVIRASVKDQGSCIMDTFAVFLADNDAEGSEVTLGGWSGEHLEEELSWSPVQDPEMGHWIIGIKGLWVNNQQLNFCENDCKAAVDTGTSLLAVPQKAFPELYELLRHPAPLEGHCEGPGPLLHFEFEEFSMTLGPREYAQAAPTPKRKAKPKFQNKDPNITQTTRSDVFCRPMLMSLDMPEPLGPKLFILGEPVLRKYYTVYDAHTKRVGFGRAKHQSPWKNSRPLPGPVDAPHQLRRSPPSMFGAFHSRKMSR